MKRHANAVIPPVADSEWIAFPGGELEGRRPRVLCPACREQLRRTVDSRRSPAPGAAKQGSVSWSGPPSAGRTGRLAGSPLCFACYRAELLRDRALQTAGELDTASDARFQSLLPLEPVNRSRLVRLQAERESVRLADRAGAGACVDRRRHAQIAARHALQQLGAGLRRHAGSVDVPRSRAVGGSGSPQPGSVNLTPFATAEARATHASEVWSAIHAAELQLPETWLPFVTAR